MAWSFWCIPLLFGLTHRSPSYFLFLLPGAFSPAIAAVVVRKWVIREGFAGISLRLNFCNNRIHYLIAWLLTLLVVAIIVLLAVIFRISTPDFSLERVMNTLAVGQNPLETYLSLSFCRCSSGTTGFYHIHSHTIGRRIWLVPH
jgi:hypothetical protein